MALTGIVFLTTFVQFIAATDIQLAMPPPINPRNIGFPRVPVGLIRPVPSMHLGPRLPHKLPHPMNKIWLKKFNPRIGSWIKILKEKPNVISPHLRRLFLRKAKINKMKGLRKFSRINFVRHGLHAIHGQRRAYQNFNKKPKRMIKNRPGIGFTGFLGQGIAKRTHSPLNILRISRRPFISRKNKFDGRFNLDNDHQEDLKFDDYKGTVGIQNSFGSRFNAGFRNNNNQPLNINQGLAGVGAGALEFGAGQNIMEQPSIPPVTGNVAGFQPNDNYQKNDNVPSFDMQALGLVGPQARVLNPANEIKSSVNDAIQRSFDQKNEGSFVGMTGTEDVRLNQMHPDGNQQFQSLHITGNTGILGNHQSDLNTHSGHITGPMHDSSLFNDRTPIPAMNPNPVGDIGFQSSGITSFMDDNRLPDGLLHDLHDVENLDKIRGDMGDELDDIHERLNLNEPFNIEDRRDFDDQLGDRFSVDDRHPNSFQQIPQAQSRVNNEFRNTPHIAQSSDRFDEKDRNFEFDNGHHGHDESLRQGHDDSPIDGLELLGSSRWTDIISELTNAASHNQIFNKIPRESIPVFPVNPHSSSGLRASGAHDIFGDRQDEIEIGPDSLALLGIDPRNVASSEIHPPPFTTPETFETMRQKNSVNSLTTSDTVMVTKTDDSVTKVVTKEPFENSKGVKINLSTSGSHGPKPTHDISNAAKRLAMFGALDNLDFGNDSFDEDLRV